MRESLPMTAERLFRERHPDLRVDQVAHAHDTRKGKQPSISVSGFDGYRMIRQTFSIEQLEKERK